MSVVSVPRKDNEISGITLFETLILAELVTCTHVDTLMNQGAVREIEARIAELGERLETETRLEAQGFGSTFVEEGRCICGSFLTGGKIHVMQCCGRRIHMICLKDWINFDFEPLRRQIRAGELTMEEAKAKIRSKCDCGATVFERDVSDPSEREKEWKKWLDQEIAKIRCMDELSAENYRMILGSYGEDTPDKISKLPAITNMGWKRMGRDFIYKV